MNDDLQKTSETQLQTQTQTENLNNSFYGISKDWLLVVAFAIFDIFLVIVARNYFHSINVLTSQAIITESQIEKEKKTLQILEELASTGSWENFEKVRVEEVAHFLSTNTRPTPGNALYFFPETLPSRSFEKEFALNELQPGIDALKQAYKEQQNKKIESAYKLLKSRVKNYELGVNADSRDLSEEAKKFLKLYQEFTHFNHVEKRNPASLGQQN